MIRAYLSHFIRGIEGHEGAAKNNKEAKMLASMLRIWIPDLELYVPAEMDEFVYLAWTKKYLTEEQILEIDCEILEDRDFVIVFTHGTNTLSKGMEVEVNFAEQNNIPVFYIDVLDAGAIERIKSYVEFLKED